MNKNRDALFTKRSSHIFTKNNKFQLNGILNSSHVLINWRTHKQVLVHVKFLEVEIYVGGGGWRGVLKKLKLLNLQA